MQADTANDAFTPEQIAWMEKRSNAIRPTVDRVFDRTTLMWIIGGLTALGVVVAGLLYEEIGKNRAEIGKNRAEIGKNRAEIGKNRAAIVELAKGQARIEAILDERLPRLAQ